MKLENISTNDFDELVKLSFFVEVAKSISRSNTIDETIHQIMVNIGEIFTPRNWSLLLKEPDDDKLKFVVVIGEGNEKIIGRSINLGEGVAGWIATHKEAVIIDNVHTDERFCQSVDKDTGFETTSIIGVPLISGNKVFGVIELINKTNGEQFTAIELKLLKTIADFAAIAIEKAYFNRTLKKLAHCDSMTGLFNRGTFDRCLTDELMIRKRYGTPLSLLMIDIDNFKTINDTYGHLAGDKVILSLSKILLKASREVDKVCRYGGDEFVIILPNTDNKQCIKMRSRIINMINEQNEVEDNITFKVSIGVHTFNSNDKSLELDLLDKALYKEKEKAHKMSYDVCSVSKNLNLSLKEERSEKNNER